MKIALSKNQEQVEIEIYEGIGRPAIRDNNLLGRFEMSGIPKMKRGSPKILIEFNVSTNGVLDVSASVESTDIKNNITVTNKSRLAPEEIERMKKEAEKFKDDDNEYKEVVQLHNEFERLLNTASDNLEKQKDLQEDKMKEYTATIDDYRSWIASNSHPTLKDCKDKFEEATEKLADLIKTMKGDSMKDTMKNFTSEQIDEMFSKTTEKKEEDNETPSNTQTATDQLD